MSLQTTLVQSPVCWSLQPAAPLLMVPRLLTWMLLRWMAWSALLWLSNCLRRQLAGSKLLSLAKIELLSLNPVTNKPWSDLICWVMLDVIRPCIVYLVSQRGQAWVHQVLFWCRNYLCRYRVGVFVHLIFMKSLCLNRLGLITGLKHLQLLLEDRRLWLPMLWGLRVPAYLTGLTICCWSLSMLWRLMFGNSRESEVMRLEHVSICWRLDEFCLLVVLIIPQCWFWWLEGLVLWFSNRWAQSSLRIGLLCLLFALG